MKKPASPRKEDGLKISAMTKAATEAPKKITKPASASGASTKSSAKPTKASSAASKQSSVVAAKSGPKPKGATELSVEKSSPKCGRTSKISAAAAASKKSGSKGKEAVNGKYSECKSELVTTENTEDVAEQKHSIVSRRGGDSLALQPESIPKQSEIQSGDVAGVTPAANSNHQVKSAAADTCKLTEGSKVKQSPSGVASAHIGGGQVHEISSPNFQRDTERPIDTPCSMGSTDTPIEDSWSAIHHQISPESETGSTHTTSSDDIKPRSEDYDAGGSQDDDGSNDRGVSKCGTMRCHDFLGRSSSDTSTPEELKMYEGGAGLRVEVRLRGREAETTSEEEGQRQRPRSWLQKDELRVKEDSSQVEATVKSLPDHQLLSSEEEEDDDDDDDEEETEDEKSEVEVIPGHAPPPPPTDPSPHFQGIVNLAFDDDGVEQENEQPDYQSSNFRRSVLLSVDECEELGSEEGSVQTPPQQPNDAVTPCDVFESCDSAGPPSSCAPSGEQLNHLPCQPTGMKLKTNAKEQDKKSSIFLTEIQEPAREQSNHIQMDGGKCSTPPPDANTKDVPHQERPCHLDLRHTEQYNGALHKNHTNPSESRKADLHLDLNEPQLTGDSPVHAAQSPAGNV